MTFSDKLVLIFLTILTLLSFGFVRALLPRSGGRQVVVMKSSQPIWEHSLDDNGVFTIQGGLGEMKIEINSGKVRVKESVCPLKVCVHEGWIDSSGGKIICLPNRVVVQVGGEKDVDALLK